MLHVGSSLRVLNGVFELLEGSFSIGEQQQIATLTSSGSDILVASAEDSAAVTLKLDSTRTAFDVVVDCGWDFNDIDEGIPPKATLAVPSSTNIASLTIGLEPNKGQEDDGLLELELESDVTVSNLNVLAGLNFPSHGNGFRIRYYNGGSEKEFKPADANLDGVTDVSDFNIWNANKNTSDTDWSRGDFNGDRETDSDDYDIWFANKFQ